MILVVPDLCGSLWMLSVGLFRIWSYLMYCNHVFFINSEHYNRNNPGTPYLLTILVLKFEKVHSASA